MSPQIALIDYKAGNLTSVRKALAAVGAEVFTPEDARRTGGRAGHHRARRRPLRRDVGARRRRGWTPSWRASAKGGRSWGSASGLQWLYEDSEESPELKGLGVFSAARAASFAAATDDGQVIKVPHVGWNSLERIDERADRRRRRRRRAGVLHPQLRRAGHAPTRPRRRRTANGSRPSCSAARSPACSFTPRSRVRSGSRFSATS